MIYTKESNDIIDVIYRHPKMDVNNFIDDKLDTLVHNLSFEKNKKIFIAGDFNFDLLKITNNTEIVSVSYKKLYYKSMCTICVCVQYACVYNMRMCTICVCVQYACVYNMRMCTIYACVQYTYVYTFQCVCMYQLVLNEKF